MRCWRGGADPGKDGFIGRVRKRLAKFDEERVEVLRLEDERTLQQMVSRVATAVVSRSPISTNRVSLSWSEEGGLRPSHGSSPGIQWKRHAFLD